MNELLPGVFHWTTRHERIGADVESYYLVDADGGVLIDPMVPPEGIDWFRPHGSPHDVLLTNRHHYRHCGRFAEAFGSVVRCHREGMHEFVKGEAVEPFEHGDALPNGFLAVRIAELCPEETAFHTVREGGIVALGDAVVRWEPGGPIGFVPDEHMGDDPEAVKEGLRRSLRRLVDEHQFEHLLLAHGTPIVGGARDALARLAGA